MTRYHINRLGQISVCRAKPGNCPLMPDNEHIEASSLEDAQKIADKKILKKIKEKNKHNKTKRVGKVYTVKKLKLGPIFKIEDAMDSQDYEDFMGVYDPSLDPSDENYITEDSWATYEDYRNSKDTALYRIKDLSRHSNLITNKDNINKFMSDLAKIDTNRKALLRDLDEVSGVDTVTLYDINQAERDPVYQEFISNNYKGSDIMDDDYVTEEKWQKFMEYLDDSDKTEARKDVVVVNIDENTRIYLEVSRAGEGVLKTRSELKLEPNEELEDW